jgi:DNA-binding Lrp family transcriptional regulator
MVDGKDLQILCAISEQGTGSPEIIQSKTGIPKSTIHYRLENLREEGIIKNDLYDIDAKALGLTITVISEVWAEYQEGYHHEIGEKLSETEGVNQVYFTMGNTDFVVISHLTSQEMTEQLIESFESIDGIERTSSKFVITTVKDEPHLLNDFDLETLVEALV